MKKVKLKSSEKNLKFHEDAYDNDSTPRGKKRLTATKRIRKQDLDIDDEY